MEKPQPKPIREEDGVHKEWYTEAKGMTLDKLPAFLERLTTEYQHDYGTICHAITAAAVAAAWAVERSPQGGITGFQASCIMWEFMGQWGDVQAPARLLRMEDMLYPQMEHKFTTISKETWEHLQKKASDLLARDNKHTSPRVAAHWAAILAGVVPFGFKVGED